VYSDRSLSEEPLQGSVRMALQHEIMLLFAVMIFGNAPHCGPKKAFVASLALQDTFTLLLRDRLGVASPLPPSSLPRLLSPSHPLSHSRYHPSST